MNNYKEAWQKWREDPERYWEKTAENIHWDKKWNKVLDTSDSKCIKWFVGGKLNLCYNCVDRNVEEGHGDKTVIIHESFYTMEVRKFTFNELLDQVSKFAGVLHDYGVTEDSHILINLPMIPEVIVAVLACARLGAPYIVMTNGYTHMSLKERIEELQPKVIVSTNCSFLGADVIDLKSILDKALEISEFSPSKCIILQRKCGAATKMQPPRDISWEDVMAKAKPHSYLPVDANHPLFIMYTSGSTGKPKGIVHSVGGVAVGLFKDNLSLLGANDGRVHWTMSQLSWIAGQICVCYAPLLGKTATIVYEGPILDPDVADIHRILSTYDISSAFIPTDAIRSLRRKDPKAEMAAKYGPFSLKHIMTGGSPIDQATSDYARNVYKTTIMQIYAQTELGSCMTMDASSLSWKENWPPLSSSKPCPGWEVKILRDDHTEASVGEIGNIVVKFPLGPGVMLGIFKNENMFYESYLTRFPGYYDTKDQGKFDKEGFLYVTNRTDSVFKINGTRYSLDGIEKVIQAHPSIAQCSVTLKTLEEGASRQKFFIPFGFYVIRSDVKTSANISEEIKQSIINELGTDLVRIQLFGVKRLPMLISGKPARSVIKAIVNEWPNIKEQPQPEDEGIICIYEAMKEMTSY